MGRRSNVPDIICTRYLIHISEGLSLMLGLGIFVTTGCLVTTHQDHNLIMRSYLTPSISQQFVLQRLRSSPKSAATE